MRRYTFNTNFGGARPNIQLAEGGDSIVQVN